MPKNRHDLYRRSSWLEWRINGWVGMVALMLFFVLMVLDWGAIANWTAREVLISVATVVYLVIAFQAGLFVYWMLYAWNDLEKPEKNKSPKHFTRPWYSFTALLPVRKEEAVIKQTIAAIDAIDYPEELKELLVLVRGDDVETMRLALEEIDRIGKTNVRMVVVNDLPINKPNQLNWGLLEAKSDVVVVFDAEDQPHKDIYKVANTVMVREAADVVQSGVQLMNYKSKWFSGLNVLEYFFWFKSALHWFADQGVVPLGGNTVFIKREKLVEVGGWDEHCLTEDADTGIRLSLAGAKIKVVYDERHATQEETPHTEVEFIKQRTRWNQGFLQIFAKGEWLKFDSLKKRVLAGYLLVLPEFILAVVIATLVLSVVVASLNVPMWLSLLSYLPAALVIVQAVVLAVGIYEFNKGYGHKYSPLNSLGVILMFIPYAFTLAVASIRAIYRFVVGDLVWEKTAHKNAHREAGVALAAN